MSKHRNSHAPQFKAKVALESLKEHRLASELASLYKIHPMQISKWKSVFMKNAVDLFSDKRKRHERDNEELIEELYRQIGQQKVELDWLKKKSGIIG